MQTLLAGATANGDGAIYIHSGGPLWFFTEGTFGGAAVTWKVNYGTGVYHDLAIHTAGLPHGVTTLPAGAKVRPTISGASGSTALTAGIAT